MPSEPPSGAGTSQIAVRPFIAEHQSFLTRVAPRIHPGQTVSPRDPAALDRFFSDLQRGRLLTEPGSEAFVATIDGETCELVSVHPDKDYFTGHPRAYVDILVVAREVEGRGVGRALLDYVERWAGERVSRGRSRRLRGQSACDRLLRATGVSTRPHSDGEATRLAAALATGDDDSVLVRH
jgi:GNAT superfamily N-acetyltransferase